MINIIPEKEQNEAIRADSGPVLIIAGAGTGKTFTITQRIIYLINKKKVSPEKILALTFTEKAAGEMLERVDQGIPLGYPEIPIFTFHSFCDKFLREEAINIGLSSDYKIMTQTDEIYFIRKNLYKFDFDYFQPRGNPTKFVIQLVKHISRLQDEGISIKDYENYFVKQKKRKKELKTLEELVNFYKKYQELKQAEDLLTFGDLITKTYYVLTEREDIRKSWQDRFKYILIDEFQDTNYAQYEMIKLLLDNSKKANIMVVADDDQSIYKFRGAAVSNVLEFSRDFPEAKKIVLTINRRSVQKILDASYNLIQNNNPDRLEVKEKIQKKLIAKASDTKQFPAPVEFRFFLKAEDEAEGIALEIVDLVKNQSKINKEQVTLSLNQNLVRYSDIAVLVRAHNHSDEITAAFRRHGIPFQFFGTRKLFNQQEIKDLVNFLRVLVDYTDDIAMNGLLDYDIWKFSDREVIDINVKARNYKKSIFEILEKNSKLNFKLKTQLKTKKLVNLIKTSWKEMRSHVSIWQILYKFVNDSGYIENLSELTSDSSELVGVVSDISDQFEKENKLRNISRFFDFVDRFEKRNVNATVYDFVDYLDLILSSGDSPLVDDSEYEKRNAVNILTLHAAKGLEFPVVFMPSNVRGRFPSNDKQELIPIPDELIKEILPKGDENIQEERRLAYVGITRAKYKVYLSAAKFYGEGKRVTKISPFIIDIFGEKEIKAALLTPINHKVTFQKIIDQKEKFFKEKKRISYLSYSQVQTYKICPRQYKYKYVLKIPSKPNAALSFGNTIHSTLKSFYEIIKRAKLGLVKEKVTIQTLMKFYKDKWISDGYLNKEHEKKSFKKGMEILKKFYKTFVDFSTKPYLLEQQFYLPLGNIKITGRIDRIDIIRNGVSEEFEIIDYKTGDKSPKLNEAEKNEQLAIYALAAEKIFGIKVSRLSLLFVDKNIKISTDSKKIKQLTEKVMIEIGELAKKIGQEVYDAKPGFMCRYCDYNSICKYAV